MALASQTRLIFALSLCNVSEPQTSGWPLAGVTFALTEQGCRFTESGEAPAWAENDLEVFGL